MIAVQESFAGPLPPPAILAGYDHVLPGAAERILKMAETQSAHRQSLEKAVVELDIKKSYWGLGAAVFIAALSIICGSVLVYFGQPVAGGVIATSILVSLVGVILRTSRVRAAEREAKSQVMMGAKKKA